MAKGKNPLFGIYPADLLPKQQYDNRAWAKEHALAMLLTADDPMIPNTVQKQFYDGIAEPKKILPRDYELMMKFIADNAPE